jgi:hypothetical protein
MLTSASLHLIDQLASPSPPSSLQLSLISTYLHSLSHHLSSSFFPPLSSDPLPLGHPGTTLTAAAVTACIAIELCIEIYGASLREKWPRCEELRGRVRGRERIRKWDEGRLRRGKEDEGEGGLSKGE